MKFRMPECIAKPSRKISVHISTRILVGLILLIPIFATYSILKFGFDIVDNILKPLLALLPIITDSTPGISTISLILFAYLIGFISLFAFGKKLVRFIERLLYRVPIFGFFYKLIHPAIKTILPQIDGQENQVGKVVCVVFKQLEEAKFLGLLMRILPVEEESLCDAIPRIEYNGVVYFGSSPTPQSGQFCIMPLHALRDVEVAFLPEQEAAERYMTIEEFKSAIKRTMGVDDLTKSIVSLGTMIPGGIKLRVKSGLIEPKLKIPA